MSPVPAVREAASRARAGGGVSQPRSSWMPYAAPIAASLRARSSVGCAVRSERIRSQTSASRGGAEGSGRLSWRRKAVRMAGPHRFIISDTESRRSSRVLTLSSSACSRANASGTPASGPWAWRAKEEELAALPALSGTSRLASIRAASGISPYGRAARRRPGARQPSGLVGAAHLSPNRERRPVPSQRWQEGSQGRWHARTSGAADVRTTSTRLNDSSTLPLYLSTTEDCRLQVSSTPRLKTCHLGQ